MKPKSLRVAVSAYLEELVARPCSEAHVRTVKHRLTRFARGREDTDLRTAAAHLDAYFADLRAAGLASGTLAGHKSTHLAFWRWCAGKRWCSASVTKPLRTRSNRYSFRPVHRRAADCDDFAAVVACLPAFAAHRGWRPRDVRDAALISLIADSARRRGEVWNLRRVALELALSKPGKTESGRRVYHAESEGKTGPVVIRFYDETADLLRRWLQHVPPSAGYVFISLRTGRRLELDVLRIGLSRICEFAGATPFGFQAARKRVVTSIIAATGDAKVGQLLAGHTDERTTQAYYNDVREALVDAAAGELSGRLRGGDALARAFFGLDDRKP